MQFSPTDNRVFTCDVCFTRSRVRLAGYRWRMPATFYEIDTISISHDDYAIMQFHSHLDQIASMITKKKIKGKITLVDQQKKLSSLSVKRW